MPLTIYKHCRLLYRQTPRILPVYRSRVWSVSSSRRMALSTSRSGPCMPSVWPALRNEQLTENRVAELELKAPSSSGRVYELPDRLLSHAAAVVCKYYTASRRAPRKTVGSQAKKGRRRRSHWKTRLPLSLHLLLLLLRLHCVRVSV